MSRDSILKIGSPIALLQRTFKLSNNKNFETKFWDVIGVYLNPPERSVVFCCDEKANARHWSALSSPCLWAPTGFVQATHDYVRHGTITLFAALNFLDGKIYRRTAVQTAEHHTHKEWLAFIKQLENQTPE